MKSRNTKILAALGILSIVSLAVLGYAYFIEPFRLVVNRQEVKISGLDPKLDGMKFVLISDIHGGSHGSDVAMMHRIVEAANAQNTDAIFLLGDFVSTTRDRQHVLMPPKEIADALTGLRAKHGVFAVMGNHDGSFGDSNVARELERAGIQVLDGKVAVIDHNGQKLRLLGLKDHFHIQDWKSYSANAKDLLAPTEGVGPVLALQHSPDVLPVITGDLLISNELKLMFAGHTHGGQVWLPILGYPVIPSIYGQKYAAGHVKDGGIDMFVTTGIGTSLLPFRFLVPPEIAVVTIRSS